MTTWRVTLLLALASLSTAPGARAQGAVNASSSIGGAACPQTLYPGPLAVAVCSNGNANAFAHSTAEFGGSSGAVVGTVSPGIFSSLTSTANAGGAWNDVLTWSDPSVSLVVFTFLWGDNLYVRSQDPSVAPGSSAWASSALSASIGVPGGASAQHSSFLAAGGPLGPSPGLFMQFAGKPTFSVPVAGLASIPVSFSWQSQAFATGDAQAASDTFAELLTVQLYDANGQHLLPQYQFANGMLVAEVTPEPASVVLVLTGLLGLYALAFAHAAATRLTSPGPREGPGRGPGLPRSATPQPAPLSVATRSGRGR